MARGDGEDHSKVAIDPDRPVKLRVNVTLDSEHAEKLEVLARDAYVNPGTMARSLLSQAIDQVDVDQGNLAAIVRSIPGALERAELGRKQYESGQSVSEVEFGTARGQA